MNQQRLSMPVGEAMFSQRSVRKFKPDPIPVDDLHLIMEAAVRAPNGGNSQPGRGRIWNYHGISLRVGTGLRPPR